MASRHFMRFAGAEAGRGRRQIRAANQAAVARAVVRMKRQWWAGAPSQALWPRMRTGTATGAEEQDVAAHHCLPRPGGLVVPTAWWTSDEPGEGAATR